jgi:hypothetical protein
MFKMLVISCFLVCFGHHYPRHHHVVRHYHSTQQEPDKNNVPAELRPTGSCKAIANAYDTFETSWESGFGADVHRDKFVTRYPVAEQHRVLVCLEETGRGITQ